MIPSPCFGCTKRCLGCRSECKGWAVYTALKERHDCIREQQRKESPYIEREHIKSKAYRAEQRFAAYNKHAVI